jgi:hypothetical protein
MLKIFGVILLNACGYTGWTEGAMQPGNFGAIWETEP